MKANLVGLPKKELLRLLAPTVDRPFRAKQVARWMLVRRASSFEEMTDIPKWLREKLESEFEIKDPETVAVTTATDGTAKYLVRLQDGTEVECVAIPDPKAGKVTFCLSTQAGCALGCAFCATGALMGAGRNLSSAEIVGQFRVMARDYADKAQRLNVVFMGMGEPLLNFEELARSLAVLLELISPKRVTVSTAGVVEGIRKLSTLPRKPKLAVSLNAGTQRTRLRMMPVVARRWPLKELLDVLRAYPLEGGWRITLEYVLVAGVNDSRREAEALVRIAKGFPSKVNVIPFNPWPGAPAWLRPPDDETIEKFVSRLVRSGVTVTVRRSRGAGVQAACGQLAAGRKSQGVIA